MFLQEYTVISKDNRRLEDLLYIRFCFVNLDFENNLKNLRNVLVFVELSFPISATPDHWPLLDAFNQRQKR